MGSVAPPRSRQASRLAGVVAAALALGVTELIAGALPGAVSLVGAVGDAAVDWLPGPVVRFGIEAFGTDDKTVLVGVILILSAVLGAVLARAGDRRPALPLAGFAAFGVVGGLAALRDPQARLWAVATCAAAGATAGVAALRFLLRLGGAPPPPEPAVSGAQPIGVPDRRAFLAA
ncbi:MAG: molybdopterin-dependent oxidoreductase, partial [Acidimicrobiia bacterium]